MKKEAAEPKPAAGPAVIVIRHLDKKETTGLSGSTST